MEISPSIPDRACRFLAVGARIYLKARSVAAYTAVKRRQNFIVMVTEYCSLLLETVLIRVLIVNIDCK